MKWEVITMAETNLYKEIANIKNHRRRAYFLWKNKIKLIRDYGAMTKEEFIELCNSFHKDIKDPENFLFHCERWESTPEYKRLMFLLKEDDFAMDLLDIYEKTKKKALKGDSQAIKNVIMLQQEIKKYRKSIDELKKIEEMEEDDGLIV